MSKKNGKKKVFRKVIQQFTDGEHVCIVWPSGRFFLDCGRVEDSDPHKRADMIVDALNYFDRGSENEEKISEVVKNKLFNKLGKLSEAFSLLSEWAYEVDKEAETPVEVERIFAKRLNNIENYINKQTQDI
jgi:hypothetical protein